MDEPQRIGEVLPAVVQGIQQAAEAPPALSEERIAKGANALCAIRRRGFDVPRSEFARLYLDCDPSPEKVRTVEAAAEELFAKHPWVVPADQAKIVAAARIIAEQDDEVYRESFARALDAIRSARMEALLTAIGRRHGETTIRNFVATSAAQKTIKTAVARYAEAIEQNVQAGRGLILFGPAGTGKTHLASAVAKAAVESRFTVAWKSGPDLFAAARAMITHKENEDRFLSQFTAPDVLVLDDLAPAAVCLTDYQGSLLFLIVDTRYRDVKSTVVTMNAESGEDAAAKIGAPTQDRLRDGATCLYFNWPSNRRALS